MMQHWKKGAIALAVLALSAGAAFAQDTGSAAGGWLGVAIAEDDGQVVVGRVQSGSPADAADLLIGDVIVTFNGEAIDSAEELVELVGAAAPGSDAALEVLRNGETVTLDVTLGSQPAQMGRPGRGDRPNRPEMIDVDPLTLAEDLLIADLTESEGGYQVDDVLNNRNPFGLEVGDVVTALNGVAVAEMTPQALIESMMVGRGAAPTVTVERGGETVTLEGDLSQGRGFMFSFGPGMGLEIFGQGMPFFGPGMGEGFGPGMGGRDGRGGPHGFFFGPAPGAPTEPEAPVTNDNSST